MYYTILRRGNLPPPKLLGVSLYQLWKQPELIDAKPTQHKRYDKLWNLVSKHQKNHHAWYKGPLFQLDAEECEDEAQQMWRVSFKLQSVFEQVHKKNVF